MGRKLALLIATYTYEDEGLRQLTAPGHDAQALRDVLRDPDIAGFDVTILEDRSRYEVGLALGEFFRGRRHDDLTLLYFTGHGIKDEEGQLHLAMTDARRDNLDFTTLRADEIDRAMTRCMSRRQVLILDCCYSGAFPAGRLAKADTEAVSLDQLQGRGRTVLTASDATQYSFEDGQVQGSAPQSVFTRHLVQGLRDGSADLNGDGDITLDELYAYVHAKVIDEMPQQRPQKKDSVEGHIVIARNVNWSLPAHLRNALNSPFPTDRLGAVESLAHLYRVGNETVRRRAAEELRRLADDDSRSVTREAAARLRAPTAQAPLPDKPAHVPAAAAPSAPEATAPPTVTPEPPPPALVSFTRSSGRHSAPRRPPPGTLRWRFRTNGCVQSAPAVMDGTVYVGSDDGALYAVDAASGEEKWRSDISSDAIRSAPQVDGDLVYVTSGRALHAVDVGTGEVCWQYMTGGQASATVAVDADCVYVGGSNLLRALDIEEGTKRWESSGYGLTDFRWVVMAGPMAILGNAGSHVYAFDSVSRQRKWAARVPGGPVSGPSALFDAVLYIGTKRGEVHAIDTYNGVRKWLHTTGHPILSAPTAADGTVYVGDDDARLSALDAATGEWKWRFTVSEPIRTSPAVAGDTVYFGCDDGNVYAVDTDSGFERWWCATGRSVRSSPVVADGVVYVGSDSDFLYAIEAADD